MHQTQFPEKSHTEGFPKSGHIFIILWKVYYSHDMSMYNPAPLTNRSRWISLAVPCLIELPIRFIRKFLYMHMVEFRYLVECWEKKGVPFKSHLHIPEVHPVTNTLFCERDEDQVQRLCPCSDYIIIHSERHILYKLSQYGPKSLYVPFLFICMIRILLC